MLLENMTLGQLLRRSAEQYPDRPALEYRETVYSYRQMDDLVDRFSLALLNHGVRRGDHIAILCETEPNTILLSYAITRIGGVVVMLNTSLLRAELVARLNKADIRYLLIGDGWLHTGDMGWLDEDGNVHLCGRLKELIIRGGENISPKEIETVFFEDPRILQCRAISDIL